MSVVSAIIVASTFTLFLFEAAWLMSRESTGLGDSFVTLLAIGAGALGVACVPLLLRGR